MNRQSERRECFLFTLAQMPRWETWETEHLDADGNSKIRQHVKLIPRAVRRDMAYKRSRREFRQARGLPEPREEYPTADT